VPVTSAEFFPVMSQIPTAHPISVVGFSHCSDQQHGLRVLQAWANPPGRRPPITRRLPLDRDWIGQETWFAGPVSLCCCSVTARNVAGNEPVS
jgi:hypothetical protein